MTRETTDQEWQQLEERISEFVNRLLNEDSPVEDKPDSITESGKIKDNSGDAS